MGLEISNVSGAAKADVLLEKALDHGAVVLNVDVVLERLCSGLWEREARDDGVPELVFDKLFESREPREHGGARGEIFLLELWSVLKHLALLGECVADLFAEQLLAVPLLAVDPASALHELGFLLCARGVHAVVHVEIFLMHFVRQHAESGVFDEIGFAQTKHGAGIGIEIGRMDHFHGIERHAVDPVASLARVRGDLVVSWAPAVLFAVETEEDGRDALGDALRVESVALRLRRAALELADCDIEKRAAALGLGACSWVDKGEMNAVVLGALNEPREHGAMEQRELGGKIAVAARNVDETGCPCV
eukprot:comp23339_c0_seq1/m.58627 comp23339_c0_seq1/g.58627  ORF comp23339_c0_seq1/g.58627 comp23339_c0_seq1/m.58627 type:complete len:306 (+) comp23339_c0_seq1:813-1730(+)